MKITISLQNLFLSAVLTALLCSPYSTSAQSDVDENDTTKKITFAAIPMVNYNRSFGFMMGAMGSMYYKIDPTDTISPSSSSMVMGMYTTSKTYMALAVQEFYLKEDRWRSTLVGGLGDVYFQSYYPFPNMGGLGYFDENGVWIDFISSFDFIYLDVQRMIINDLYLGLEGTVVKAQTVFDVKNPITGEEIVSSADMNNLGYNLLYDNRNNVNFPSKGFFVQFRNNFVREALGATHDYNMYELSANWFYDINKDEKSVLVSRLYSNIAAGEVPFQGENFIGRDDLRGYSKGEYRGNQVYAAQAELRQNVYKKFGMIGFVGVGSAVDKIGDIPQATLLPSVGMGFRYLMIPKEKINVGIDVGVGKNDWSLTFRIGEAFSR